MKEGNLANLANLGRVHVSRGEMWVYFPANENLGKNMVLGLTPLSFLNSQGKTMRGLSTSDAEWGWR